jgi:hypothetical protein
LRNRFPTPDILNREPSSQHRPENEAKLGLATDGRQFVPALNRLQLQWRAMIRVPRPTASTCHRATPSRSPPPRKPKSETSTTRGSGENAQPRYRVTLPTQSPSRETMVHHGLTHTFNSQRLQRAHPAVPSASRLPARNRIES